MLTESQNYGYKYTILQHLDLYENKEKIKSHMMG